MQDQEKKTATRGRKAKAEVKEAEVREPVAQESTFTLEQVQKMIEEALAKRESEHKQEAAPAANDGMVTMIFQAEVNDANEIQLGPNGKYGLITGKHATISIPRRDFFSDFRTTMMQYLLKNRNLIVVDGLTDDERKIYGVEYGDGEYLEPAIYDRLIEMGDHVLEIYPKLHISWQEMVATKFIEAYENGTLKCSREVLIELNKISKKNYASLSKEDPRRKGAFYPIIHQMNAADEADE